MDAKNKNGVNIENSQILEFILSPLELELLKNGQRAFTYQINGVPIPITTQHAQRLHKHFKFKLKWMEQIVSELKTNLKLTAIKK